MDGNMNNRLVSASDRSTTDLSVDNPALERSVAEKAPRTIRPRNGIGIGGRDRDSMDDEIPAIVVDEPETKPGDESAPIFASRTVGKFLYPSVCSYCHTLWDRNGTTDLIAPCQCISSKLLLHKTCFVPYFKKHGDRCPDCKTVYNHIKTEDLDKEVTSQRINMCIIVVLMPIGSIITVTACLLLDASRRAKQHAAATGIPNNGLGLSLVTFSFICILVGLLTLIALKLTQSFICPRKKKTKISKGVQKV